ncbi:hypothetical protein BDY24DRAFT_434646 [Mrakia frigida]|uniref:translation initiation factor eIF2B subunit alpha n=1 Tax=Mrakia frigida TaxID=29902 RepID=UPI003FCBEFCE
MVTPTGTSSRGEEGSVDLVKVYTEALAQEYPPPLAAIIALTEAMASQSASTTSHLLLSLHHNSSLLLSSPLATYGCQAGTRLFERWVRDAVGGAARGVTIDEMRMGIVSEGRSFAKTGSGECKEKIAKNVQGFLKDDCTILTHSFSRVVLLTLKKAHEQNKRVNVYVTEGRPNCGGLKTHAALTSIGIPCTLILDSAVAYVMDRVDVVLVGSEAVVESGGLVAGLGTYQIALLAKALSKPFYSLAESYKFLRLFPLSQSDLPLLPSVLPPLSFEPVLASPYHTLADGSSALEEEGAGAEDQGEGEGEGERKKEEGGDKYAVGGKRVRGMTKEMLANNPRYDYTPRDLIHLLISDVGILTPELVGSFCGIFSE